MIRCNNKKNGNDFENQLCRLLKSENTWVYHCPHKSNGQPADIIMVRNENSRLVFSIIDCKCCSNDKFDIERIEENQYNSMKKLDSIGNNLEDGEIETLFAFKFGDDSIYIAPFQDLLKVSVKKRVLSKEDILSIGWRIE